MYKIPEDKNSQKKNTKNKKEKDNLQTVDIKRDCKTFKRRVSVFVLRIEKG